MAFLDDLKDAVLGTQTPDYSFGGAGGLPDVSNFDPSQMGDSYQLAPQGGFGGGAPGGDGSAPAPDFSAADIPQGGGPRQGGLLQGIGNVLKSPDFRLAAMAGLSSMGGNPNAFNEAMQIKQGRTQANLLKQQQASLAAKNQAFKAAWTKDANGNMQFDNQAYSDALENNPDYQGDIGADVKSVKDLRDKYEQYKNEATGQFGYYNPYTGQTTLTGRGAIKLGKDESIYEPDQPGAATGGGGGGPVAVPGAAPQGGQQAPVSSYLAAVHGREGTGKNPYSSASGTGQFTGQLDAQGNGKGTWFDVMRNDPQFAQDIAGKSDAQILAMRNDPNVADRAIQSYATSNAKALQAGGIANPNDAMLGMAHGYGPGGALKILNSNPNTPIEQIIGADTAKINGVAGQTTGQVAAGFDNRFGRGQTWQGGQGDATMRGGAAADQIAGGGAAPASKVSMFGGGAAGPTQIQGFHLLGSTVAPGGGEATLPPELQGLTGKDFLAKLPPNEASQVQALAEGRMAFPGGFAISKPYWQTMLQAVAQYDPHFDAANPQTRIQTLKAFAPGGKDRANISSIATTIGHIYDLDQSIDKLGNVENTPLALARNQARRAYMLENQQGTAFQKFDTAREAVANELTRVFRMSGGNEADIQSWKQRLDSAQGPSALHTVTGEIMSELNSRLGAEGNAYQAGMGLSQDPRLFLPKDVQQKWNKMTNLPPAVAEIGAPVYDENGIHWPSQKGGQSQAPVSPRLQGTGGQQAQAAPRPQPALNAIPPQAQARTPQQQQLAQAQARAQGSPPSSLLQEGRARTFANGQTWALRNGRPVRVR